MRSSQPGKVGDPARGDRMKEGPPERPREGSRRALEAQAGQDKAVKEWNRRGWWTRGWIFILGAMKVYSAGRMLRFVSRKTTLASVWRMDGGGKAEGPCERQWGSARVSPQHPWPSNNSFTWFLLVHAAPFLCTRPIHTQVLRTNSGCIHHKSL